MLRDVSYFCKGLPSENIKYLLTYVRVRGRLRENLESLVETGQLLVGSAE